jgi:hypothetical protein
MRTIRVKLLVGVTVWLGMVLLVVVGLLGQTATSTSSVQVVSAINPTTERVSIRTDGGETNNHSERPSISADGRFVAFASTADNLVANDTNNASDIFVYDRLNGTIERVSIRSDGGQANFGSFAPAISADGNIVVFHSLPPTFTTMIPTTWPIFLPMTAPPARQH